MLTVLLALGIFVVFFALMSVRLLFLKNGEFKGTCASQSPFLNKEGIVCNVCGKNPEFCENKTTETVEMPAFK